MKSTPIPYNADIGPGGPDMNARVGFPRVQTAMKQKMSPFMAADQASAVPQSGSMPMTVQPAFASNVSDRSGQNRPTSSDISGFRSGSFKR